MAGQEAPAVHSEFNSIQIQAVPTEFHKKGEVTPEAGLEHRIRALTRGPLRKTLHTLMRTSAFPEDRLKGFPQP